MKATQIWILHALAKLWPKKWLTNNSSLQHPLLHPLPFLSTQPTSSVRILDARKITKCHTQFTLDLTNIDLDNLVENVKCLPHAFNGIIIFILPHVKVGVLDAYEKAMDGMDKIYDGHAWCQT